MSSISGEQLPSMVQYANLDPSSREAGFGVGRYFSGKSAGGMDHIRRDSHLTKKIVEKHPGINLRSKYLLYAVGIFYHSFWRQSALTGRVKNRSSASQVPLLRPYDVGYGRRVGYRVVS